MFISIVTVIKSELSLVSVVGNSGLFDKTVLIFSVSFITSSIFLDKSFAVFLESLTTFFNSFNSACNSSNFFISLSLTTISFFSSSIIVPETEDVNILLISLSSAFFNKESSLGFKLIALSLAISIP